MSAQDWFENVFAVLVSLAVMHYTFAFYGTLLRKFFGLFGGIGGRFSSRQATSPVSYRRTDG